MIQEGLKFLAEQAVSAAGPQTIEIEGIEYTCDAITPVRPPRAAAIVFQSLNGIVGYLKNSSKDVLPEGLLLHVFSPWQVNLYGPLDAKYRDREVFAAARRDPGLGFNFGNRFEIENFTIALMMAFDETPAREQLIRIVGNMTAERIWQSTDDGFSQEVAQKAGISLVKREQITNPFMLSPHRTFPEVAQPMSPFIFRAHQVGPDKLPQVALYECDNDVWKLEAIKSIASWLTKAFEKESIAIPVLA